MIPSFFGNSKSTKFKPSEKVKEIVEDSKYDYDDFKPKFGWDPKNPPRPIWKAFNVVRNEDNINDKGWIVGDDTDDYIRGTDDNDTIHGSHGSDLIYGGDGDDVLYGDSQTYRSTEGRDTIYGGNGDDEIRADVAYGQEGDDDLRAPHSGGAYLNGGNGDDDLKGRSDEDTLIGGAGNDTLEGAMGKDTMTGGRGVDTFVVGHQNDLRTGEISSDLITDFRDVGDKIKFELVAWGRLAFEELDFEFSRAGSLVVSHESDVLAEIRGLNPNVGLYDQIQNIGVGTIELIAQKRFTVNN